VRLLAAGTVAALTVSGAPAHGARAVAIQISVPGSAPVRVSVASPRPYVYPADGAIVRAVSIATGKTTARVTGLSLFGGEITAVSVAAGGASGIQGLVALGRPVVATPDAAIPLGDWGYAVTLEAAGGPARPLTALDVVLTAPHGGLPAGSELQIAYAQVAGASSAPADIPTIVAVTAPPSRPLTVRPGLGERGYAFPVYGPAFYSDTYGAARADVSGGWHHGDDIFAPLGAPVLAVAHGVVFSVGWDKAGGRRLWLRDDRGNEFYYAHLSAYSPLALDGAIVDAGDVLGFVGDSGDAEGTPYHLHFEIHPVGLLDMGYDGAVDPTSYLRTWRRVQTVQLEAAAGWTPPPAVVRPPAAGAVLVRSRDISSCVSFLSRCRLGR
jgi:murein DD-endopeptidase MepM/ murein hydrolase activator NlpD